VSTPIKQIIHHITIPPKVTTPINIKDEITSHDVKVNSGEATITPKPDGSIDVTIPETIGIIEPELRWKVSYDGSFGVSYEIIQLQKWILDGNVYADRAGVGISYYCWHNLHLGIEETAAYGNGELKTRLYMSIPLQIK
jgi:hypothetical protein